jgi:hypothetical protein
MSSHTSTPATLQTPAMQMRTLVAGWQHPPRPVAGPWNGGAIPRCAWQQPPWAPGTMFTTLRCMDVCAGACACSRPQQMAHAVLYRSCCMAPHALRTHTTTSASPNGRRPVRPDFSMVGRVIHLPSGMRLQSRSKHAVSAHKHEWTAGQTCTQGLLTVLLASQPEALQGAAGHISCT